MVLPTLDKVSRATIPYLYDIKWVDGADSPPLISPNDILYDLPIQTTEHATERLEQHGPPFSLLSSSPLPPQRSSSVHAFVLLV